MYAMNRLSPTLRLPCRLLSTKTFSVNGALSIGDRYFYLDPSKQNESLLLPSIRASQYVMLYGPRASGKSTRLNALQKQLEQDYVVLRYVQALTVRCCVVSPSSETALLSIGVSSSKRMINFGLFFLKS